jgi:CRP/FNR family transcriptional regulator, cyclic AMP receptor protein
MPGKSELPEFASWRIQVTERGVRSHRRLALAHAKWPRGTFLERLPEAVRVKVLELGVRRAYPPDHILLRQGEAGRSVWLLLDALIKVSARVENGSESLLAIRVSGDVVGEMGVIDGAPRSATVTTCGHAVAYQIDGPVFVRFLRRYPEAAMTLSRMGIERLRWANQRRLDYTGYGTDMRLARVLLDLAGRHGRQGPDGLDIGVPMTQAELGGMVGAKEVTVQKALRSLAAQRFVQPCHQRVLITDPAGLARFADLRPKDVPQNPY